MNAQIATRIALTDGERRPAALLELIARRRALRARGRTRRRELRVREVAQQRGEVAVRLRGVRGGHALLELGDVEPAGRAVLAQQRDGRLALRVGRAQAGVVAEAPDRALTGIVARHVALGAACRAVGVGVAGVAHAQ